MKANLTVFLILTALFLWSHPAFTEETTAVEVGNQICPVDGEKVDGVTKYEYDGKIYNFCSNTCLSDFKKDPEKYIEKLEESESESESGTSGADQSY